MSSEKYPWPEFQLTAFVLGELEPSVTAEIQRAAAQDPALANEIANIRSMVEQLGELYKQESVGISPTAFVASNVAQTDTFPSANRLADASGATGQSQRRTLGWTAAIGLLATAASLMIVVALAAPGLNSFFVSKGDDLAIAVTKSDATKDNKDGVVPEESSPQVSSSLTDSSRVEERVLKTEPTVGNELPTQQVSQGQASSEIGYGGEGGAEGFGMEGGLGDLGGSELAKAEPNDHPFVAPAPDAVASAPELATKGRELAEQLAQRKESLREDAFVEGLNDVTRGAEPTATALALDYEAKDPSQVALGRSITLPAAVPAPVLLQESAEFQRASGNEQVDELYAAPMPATAASGGMMGGGGRAPLPAVAASGLSASADEFYRGVVASEEPLPNLHDGNAHYFLYRDAKRHNDRIRTNVNGDRFAPIYENPFKLVENDPLSTFSIDVDTASYVKARQFLMESRALPPANAVRVEEFINYFEYEYAGPQGEDPFAAHLAVANCPWSADHKLVRIALQAKKIDVAQRPKANIVFLLDVSGSMDEPNKLPLVKESLRLMIEQLTENDRIAMVVYAGAAGCVLESTTGDKKDQILGALDRLNAGGSTNGGQGIQLAYDIARDHFVPGGVNRVILCTDGDFNVGVTNTEELVNLVVENAKSKVFLTVLGYGMGNTNDAMMEQIANRGNGVYGMVDSRREARRQMVKQLAGNLMTVAKDVKLQVEFNPERVASYRLIGYENRALANADFANDKKDAGDIGAGHRVTALYEIVPVGAARVQPAPQSELRYQKRKPLVGEIPLGPTATDDPAKPEAVKPEPVFSNELLTVSLRYKQPEGESSKLLSFPLLDANKPFAEVDQDFKWAAAVAQFAMLLRESNHRGSSSWSGLIETVGPLATDEARSECVQMIRTAASLRR